MTEVSAGLAARLDREIERRMGPSAEVRRNSPVSI
jgi:hypothetical protein